MKSSITFTLGLSWIGLTSMAQATSKPNYFACEGGDGLRITYNLAAVAKETQFTIAGVGLQGDSYVGDEISVTPTPIGQLVTVNVQFIADHSARYLSLVLPNINLRDNANETINTSTIQTLTRTSIAGPDLVDGAIENSSFHPITCAAAYK